MKKHIFTILFALSIVLFISPVVMAGTPVQPCLFYFCQDTEYGWDSTSAVFEGTVAHPRHRVKCARCDNEQSQICLEEIITPAEAPTCTQDGVTAQKNCSICNHELQRATTVNALGHDYSSPAATCTTDQICAREGCNQVLVSALGHDIDNHEAKEASCTEVGWNAYDSCKREGCNYTTYTETPAIGHDLEHHEGKEATCTEIGWDAYDTCKREGCDYTTYEEVPPLGHDIEHHKAKAPTRTEVGWDAYDTCKREGCDYTTYTEKAASPKTGDETPLTTIIIVMIISATAILGLALYKKRNS